MTNEVDAPVPKRKKRKDALAPNGDVLDATLAIALLGIGKNQFYELCTEGKIPHRRIGRVLRFSRSALLKWLDSSSDKGLSGRRHA